MATHPPQNEKRSTEPYLDRRCGEDRREAYSLEYFAAAGRERRRNSERRRSVERRHSCIQVTRWSRICLKGTR